LTAEDEAKLDAGLGFDMTAGQRRCWLDVEEDLCRRLAPMDRLVFGDVGFGKTEMAIRAALLAVRGGRQVAVGRGVRCSTPRRRGGSCAWPSALDAIDAASARWRRAGRTVATPSERDIHTVARGETITNNT